MRAIILAAGAGTRLRPLTNDRPKCLVSVGEKALVDHQIDALRSVGVDDIVLVVGCKAAQVRAHCGASVRYIENADYLSTNSIYSLHLASAELDRPTFLFNCDILFHRAILQSMLDAPHANVVAADAAVERVQGEMNICYDSERRITAISKEIQPEEAQAQSVQLVKFDAEGARRVRREIERLVDEDQKNAYPTSAYGPLIVERSLFAVEVGSAVWGEIDSVEDHKHALECVVPGLG